MTINARHRKHFKAGNYTAPGCNLLFDTGRRLTRCVRQAIRNEDYIQDQAERRALEIQRRNEARESLQHSREEFKRPNFVQRWLGRLFGRQEVAAA